MQIRCTLKPQSLSVVASVHCFSAEGLHFSALVGTVLSHGFIEAGFFPIRVAFPTIACILKGPLTEIPDDVLLESFIDYLSTYEGDVVCEGLKATKFTPQMMDPLVSVLSRFHCLKLPSSPDNFRALLIEVAGHEMMTVPMKALHYMNSGVLASHRQFWDGFTVLELYDVFCSINCTPAQLIKSIVCQSEDPAQDRVFNFLMHFIGNMSCEQVQLFLRFVTGSSVAIGENISITFNNLSGLARRPIAHTCSCELELSVNYTTAIEFANEFKQVLASDLAWIMDAI